METGVETSCPRRIEIAGSSPTARARKVSKDGLFKSLINFEVRKREGLSGRAENRAQRCRDYCGLDAGGAEDASVRSDLG